MKDHLLVLSIRVVIALLITVGVGSVAVAQKVGESAPNFAVLDMDGIQRTLEDFQGQVLIINFWSSTCPPCRQEKPSMETFYLNKRDQDLEVLVVTGERKRRIDRYLKRYPLSFEVYRDYRGTMHRDYGVLSYPQTFIVDRSGTIVHMFFGPQDWTGSQVANLINPLLSE